MQSFVKMEAGKLREKANAAIADAKKRRKEAEEIEERNSRKFWGQLWPLADKLSRWWEKSQWDQPIGSYTARKANDMLMLCDHSGDGYVCVTDDDLWCLEP
jgi:hypothetical protein